MTTGMDEQDHWSFYDAWEAFPLSKLMHEHERSVVGEFNISYGTRHGGTLGEFRIRFYDFGRGRTRSDIAAHLEAFGDSWRVLAEGRLIDHLAALDGKPQGPGEIRSLLLSLGYVDRTAELRGDHPLPCPTCHGTGDLHSKPLARPAPLDRKETQ